MSRFLQKWAEASKDSVGPYGPTKAPPLSAAKAGKPSPQAAAKVNTMPTAMAPSTMLPSVSNQAAAVAQPNSGDVSTNTSNGNYAKMAQAEALGLMLDLMSSGSLTRNLLNMRPR